MWLVPRDSNGILGRVPLPGDLQEALVRWYVGKGSEADHRASVSLVVTARDNNKWLACDCQGEAASPPLMSPAYLSEQETYYLRRLTARPAHKRRCPFYLPPAPDRIRERIGDSLFEIDYPKGLFNAHKQAPEKLAQMPPDAEPDDRSRGASIPRLGRLLWLLLETAQCNILPELPANGVPDHSLKEEFRRIYSAARRFEIAPGISLADHLYTNAIDYEKHRVHARLREAARNWPEGYAPQAFLLLEANAISGSEIFTGLGTVEIRNRIQHTGIIRAEVDPPFLTLAVVGEHSKREGYLALRAYAQPIFKGNQFIPAEREMDRALLKSMTSFQYRMRRRNMKVAVKKPLFEIHTSKGSVRPDLVVAWFNLVTGEESDFAVQLLRSNDTQERARIQSMGDRLLEIRPTLVVEAGDVGTDKLLDALENMIG